jgi:hypothetical protein
MRTLKLRIEWFLRERREQLLISLAWLLPKSLCYWAFIRMATSRSEAHHTVTDVLAANADWYR